MKKIACFLLLSLISLANLPAATISNFGSLISSDDLTGSWFGNYNSGTSTITANEGPGSGIQDFTTAVPSLSGLTLLSFSALVTGVNPGTSFSILLYDGEFDTVQAAFNWSQFSSFTPVTSSLTTNVAFDASTITGWELATGGLGNPLTVQFASLEAIAVPEPSTYLLLGLGLAGLMVFGRGRVCRLS